MKHRILYGDAEWRQQRIVVIFLVLGGLYFSYQVLTQHPKGPAWIIDLPFIYAPLGILWGAYHLLKRVRQYVQAAPDGIRIGRMFSTLTIDYGSVRTARVLPLRQLVPEPGAGGRRRYLPPPVKAYLDAPSVVLRLQGEPEQIDRLLKTLGTRHAFEGAAVFPVVDAEGAAREIAVHLPEGAGTNLGGARRRGKRRR